MIYLLLILLIGLLLIAYSITGGDILSPWLIVITTFVFSLMITLTNVNKWNVSLSSKTVVVIFSSLVVWGLGEIIVRIVYSNRNGIQNSIKINRNIEISSWKIILISIFMGIVLVFYFKYIYRISLLAGNPSGLQGMFKYARYAVINTKYNAEKSSMLNHALAISKAMGIVCFFAYAKDRVFDNKKSLVYLLPVLLYLLQLVISTARINIIRFIVIGLFITFILIKQKIGWSKKYDKKIILYSILGLIFLFVSFRLLGMLTEKSMRRDLWYDVSLYAGSSIVALDKYLELPKIPNPFFGKETLYNVYSILRSLNLTDIPKYDTPLPFVYFSDVRTNIYTAFRRYIQDYSYFTMYLIIFFQSIFYSTLLLKVRKCSDLGLLYISVFIYPITEMFIDEQFISNTLTLSMAYQLIYITVIYKVLIKNRNLENEN